MDLERLAKVAGILEDCTLEESGLLVREAIAEITDLRARALSPDEVVVKSSDLENIRDNTLNPAHTMTKQGLEECMDLCHKIACRALCSQGEAKA